MKYCLPRFILILLLIILTRAHAQAQIVYQPKKWNAKRADLVVVIHGCAQSAKIMFDHSGWNNIADQNNLLIYYPQVPIASHPLDCWGWYLMQNQRNDIGQLRQIYSEIQNLKKKFLLPSPRIYLAGISSGAFTAAGLMACYPNEIAGAALHSGGSYGLAQDVLTAQKVLKDGPPERIGQRFCDPNQYTGDVMAIHGLKDEVVHPKNSERIILDFIDNPKIENQHRGEAGGLKFQEIKYTSTRRQRGKIVYVDGLKHEWSGYTGDKNANPKETAYFSNRGPNATQIMWDFFRSTQ